MDQCKYIGRDGRLHICGSCSCPMAVSYTHLDVYKRQVQNEKLSKSAYYLTIKLVLTFICFFAAYSYLANRSYQGTIEAKRSVERSNRMFELARQHSFATMFEYDIQKDAAYFLKERNIKALCDYDSLCPFSKLVFENRCLNETEKEKLLDALSQMADGAEKAVFEISSGIKSVSYTHLDVYKRQE